MGGAAFDLSFNERWINGPADVVRRGNFQHAHRAQFAVNRNFRQMGAESINSVGRALAIFVQRAGGWIKRHFSRQHVAVFIEGQIAQSDGALLAIVFDRHSAILELDDRASDKRLPGAGWRDAIRRPPCMQLCQ